jgi:uncharacterized damage-inducible protein DinB
MESGKFTKNVRSALISGMEQQYQDVRKIVENLTDKQLWQRPVDPGNSVGHLVLHIAGNINCFVGAELGHTGYLRDREREFTESNSPPRKQLLENLDGAVATFRRVVGGLTEEQLIAPHPTERFGTTIAALVHIVAHFALHRGQMSYIARFVKN